MFISVNQRGKNMKKVITSAVLAILTLSAPISALADDFAGIEIEIPEDWGEPSSEKTTDAGFSRLYDFNSEKIAFLVYDGSTAVDTFDKEYLNYFLWDYSETIAENHAVTRMTQEEETIDGCDYKFVEFIYEDADGWHYAQCATRNTGTHVITMIYTRQSVSVPYYYVDYVNLILNYVVP